MKILQINSFGALSTGKIAVDIYKGIVKSGYEGVIAFARGTIEKGVPYIKIGNGFDIACHGILSRITDKTGFYSYHATKKFIERVDEIEPDIIHLHNIHGYYINIEMLFEYIKEKGIKVVWTLHDCWAFTGHCTYFDLCNCNKWKTGCYKCKQIGKYPASMVMDNSLHNWKKKRELFTGLNATIVTPSKWLEDMVKQSFLNEYPVRTIYNGINTSVFKRAERGVFRKKYDLENTYIILGVASTWDERKGLKDFIALNELLKNDSRKIKIVLVGLDDRQLKVIPPEILGIKRTSTATELAEIYSAADVFFNPTYEDNYPTTNIEAIACGTPVVTYNTGGSPEGALKGNGTVIDRGDYAYIYENIGKFNDVVCDINDIDMHTFAERYIELYRSMLEKSEQRQ